MTAKSSLEYAQSAWRAAQVQNKNQRVIYLMETYAHAHAALNGAIVGTSTHKAADELMWQAVEAVQQMVGIRNPKKRKKKAARAKNPTMRSIMAKAAK